jgi:hypothetical protein
VVPPCHNARGRRFFNTLGGAFVIGERSAS